MTDRLLRRIVHSLIVIIPAFGFHSCAETKNITASGTAEMPERKEIYYFHSEDSVWLVYPVTGENGVFTGVIVDPDFVAKNKLKDIHIYAASPSAIKISNQTLTCPMENISKIDNFKLKQGMVITSIGVLLLLFSLPIFL
jgi:hypothetical protein